MLRLHRFAVLLACASVLSLPLAAQLVVSSSPSSPGYSSTGLWHVDLASGDRTLLATDWANAIAVDDAGGRVLFAQGALLAEWSYGAAQNGAQTLGTIRVANGSALAGLTGLAYGGGRLFATAAPTAVSSAWLYEVSIATLVATPIATPQQFDEVFALSFDASNGLFHAAVEGPYTGGGVGCDVYSIDLLNVGVPTFIARLPDAGGVACVASGVAYPMAGYARFIGRYDLATGAFAPQAFVAPWPKGGADAGSEFAPGLAPSVAARVYCHPSVPGGPLFPGIRPIGSASASAGSGFLLQHYAIPSGARLQSHYSFSGRAALPFLSGSRCLRAPVFRLPPVATPVNSTLYDLDFNALIAQGVHPSLLAGQTVWYQASLWAPAAFNSNAFGFTPGLEFTIQP